MSKSTDFKEIIGWAVQKIKAQEKPRNKIPMFESGQFWWVNIGRNIGIETYGKGNDYRRSVIIIRKYNKNQLLIAPTTSSANEHSDYFKFEFFDEKTNKIVVRSIILSQLKTIDSKRLIRRIPHKFSTKRFKRLLIALRNSIFDQKSIPPIGGSRIPGGS